MKRLIAALAAAGVIAAATAVAADDHDVHDMMDMPDLMDMPDMPGMMGPDSRTALRLPDTMKVMQKRMMIKHLATIGRITSALAANDLWGAADIAKNNLGWSPEEAERCENVGRITGEQGFVDLGMAVHKKADELAEAARSGDRDLALRHLSQLINRCNACHEKYRH